MSLKEAEKVDREPIRLLVIGAEHISLAVAENLRRQGLCLAMTRALEEVVLLNEQPKLDERLLEALLVPTVEVEASPRPSKDRSKKNEPWYRGFDKRKGRYR